jgi:hypothetical protein
MAFHDNFWIAAATTAPVIALAAIVSAREASDLINRWTWPESPPIPGIEDTEWFDKINQRRILKASRVRDVHNLNLGLQTLVLALSVISLGYATDLVPPLVGVILVVLGMVLVVLGQRLSISATRTDLDLRFYKTNVFGDGRRYWEKVGREEGWLSEPDSPEDGAQAAHRELYRTWERVGRMRGWLDPESEQSKRDLEQPDISTTGEDSGHSTEVAGP